MATLHLVCGKIAAGKSTLTASLARSPDTVLISEDAWLAILYPGEIKELIDYVRCAARLRAAMQGHVEAILRAGCSVILDFPANTLATRSWMKSMIDSSGADHLLHFLDVSDDECKRRLRLRNQEMAQQFRTSDEQFDLITSFLVPPTEAEGFNIVRSQSVRV